jgi:hypothetical protein
MLARDTRLYTATSFCDSQGVPIARLLTPYSNGRHDCYTPERKVEMHGYVHDFPHEDNALEFIRAEADRRAAGVAAYAAAMNGITSRDT